MKQYLKVVTVLLVILMILTGCGDLRVEEKGASTNIETTSTNDNRTPKYVQQIFDRYGEVIKQYGNLVARTDTEIHYVDMSEADFYFFNIYPTTEKSNNSCAEFSFDLAGSQSLQIKVEEFTDAYLEELLVLSLLVIEPEIEVQDIKKNVDQLLTYYMEGNKNIRDNKVVVGDYTIFLADEFLDIIGMVIHFDK